jgi:hypothetical protein
MVVAFLYFMLHTLGGILAAWALWEIFNLTRNILP